MDCERIGAVAVRLPERAEAEPGRARLQPDEGNGRAAELLLPEEGSGRIELQRLDGRGRIGQEDLELEEGTGRMRLMAEPEAALRGPAPRVKHHSTLEKS